MPTKSRPRHAAAVALSLMTMVASAARGDDRGLIGHWKLAGDAKDSSGQGNDGQNHGVDLNAPGRNGTPGGAARFDGISAFVEVPANKSLALGTGDFTLAVWAQTTRELDDVVGDLVSKFDPASRHGFNWCIKDGYGSVGSQANFRNIQFGIDSGTEPKWTDCGRPGNAVYVMALAVYDGQLFAGTCESGQDQMGHVYRYAGGTRWIDCGSPDHSNAVTALAVHEGQLYAGTGCYRLRGSLLPDSPNTTLGGNIFRYDGDGQWTDSGHLEGAEGVGGLCVFRGQLYASSMYHPSQYRFGGGQEWVPVATGLWIYALGVFNHELFGTCWNGCRVFRFDGQNWSEPAILETAGQTYSFDVHAGALYCGTWKNGHVYYTQDGKTWSDSGRLGNEMEVMGMAVYNGMLYAGTLPLAQVHRYDGDAGWTATGTLDTSDVRYRRAWSMALYQGQLFCGVLPSGHVHALTAGAAVSNDHELAPGWKHLAAVRQGDRLRLYVDGQPVAESIISNPAALDLTNEQPLRIGFGGNDYFCGSLSDLRLYGRALSQDEIAKLQ
ncbi:MAG: LamG domain-containing protein [Planctomycetaceae bacterium]